MKSSIALRMKRITIGSSYLLPKPSTSALPTCSTNQQQCGWGCKKEASGVKLCNSYCDSQPIASKKMVVFPECSTITSWHLKKCFEISAMYLYVCTDFVWIDERKGQSNWLCRLRFYQRCSRLHLRLPLAPAGFCLVFYIPLHSTSDPTSSNSFATSIYMSLGSCSGRTQECLTPAKDASSSVQAKSASV